MLPSARPLSRSVMEGFIGALCLHLSEMVLFPHLESPFSLCFHVREQRGHYKVICLYCIVDHAYHVDSCFVVVC